MQNRPRRPPTLQAVTAQDRLWAGWAKTAAGSSMAGFDGITPSDFARRLDQELPRLTTDILNGTYRPEPLRTYRRKIGGKDRIFGVSAVRDRVAQQATRFSLRPWLDDRQADSSFAYLRGRGWLDALRGIEDARNAGLRHIYRFDIKQYFESIDHSLLASQLVDDLGCVEVAALLLSWVSCPTVRGNVVRPAERGLALGMPIAPTLANHFLSEFDRAIEAHSGRLVRYADDGCVLCPDAASATTAQAIVTELLAALHLAPNPTKSTVTSFDHGFSFLGFTFQGNQSRPHRGSHFDAPGR